jgi:pantetheine-phosphate adenylyltransferase
LWVVSRLAIYPGSFDPITLGHLSVLARAAKVFDQVELLIVHNPSKLPAFNVATRVELAKASITELGIGGNVKVSTLETGLLVERAKDLGASSIIKGFRTTSDIEYELPMAQVNRDLSGIETVFFASEAGYGFVSSSLVRQVASLGGDVSTYVTNAVAKALAEQGKK